MHLIAEKRTESGWEHLPMPETATDRNYELFAFIAGVRSHYYMGPPLAEGRGLPPDLNWEQAIAHEDGEGDDEAYTIRDFFEDDGHSATWLLCSELPVPWSSGLKLETWTWAWIVWMRAISKMHGGPGNVRLTIFFDN